MSVRPAIIAGRFRVRRSHAGDEDTARESLRARTGVVDVLRQSHDLTLLFASAFVMPLVFVSSVPTLRVFFGIWIVLFAPGYAITAALPGSSEDKRGLTRVSLSFGMSIATVPLIALAIHLSPFLIQPLSVGVALTLWMLFWASVALGLRVLRGVPNPNSELTRFARDGGHARRPQSTGVAYFCVALLLGVVIGLFLLPGWTTQSISTEFYMLGAAGEARDFPRQAEVDQPISVTIGIVNQEDAAQTYWVEVWTGDLHDSQVFERVARVGPFVVDPHQKLERNVRWSMPAEGSDRLAMFALTREGESTPIRTLRLSLDVLEADS